MDKLGPIVPFVYPQIYFIFNTSIHNLTLYIHYILPSYHPAIKYVDKKRPPKRVSGNIKSPSWAILILTLKVL